MKKLFVFFLSIVVFVSCTTDEKPYSYLCDSVTGIEVVELLFNSNDSSPAFEYTLRADEMCIEWGDETSPKEYIFIGNEYTDSIKPIVHAFSSSGEYKIRIKALRLKSLMLSKINSNEINELRLTGCDKLQKLYCENQPISQIDVSDCRLLQELVCGYPEGVQTLSDITQIGRLKVLSINGPLNVDNLNLSANDSLTRVSFSKTNLGGLQMTDLKLLSNITIDKCPSFQNLYLSNNTGLKQLVITNNTSLSGESINKIFRSLPKVEDGDCVIVLRGNEGDASCDRSIAMAKGWSFKDSL